mmetsp:Transcript_19129/g.61541  ORF Transcript_19129/g.61541 Transcript_19129/m.61541 type:complete len:258 (+) Transcript_19129:768-1541(+)
MLIGNETKDDHMMSLVKVFERLAGRGYSVKAKKVKILPDEFEFLGHLSTPEGLKPLPKAIEAIEKMPKPRITENCDRAVVLRQLRSFLGLASYNRRYVKNFSKVAAPLNTMLEKDAKLEWTPDREDAWNAIIIAIAETRGVYHPDYAFALQLRVDASKRGIGGYLFQMIPNPKTGKLEERVIGHCPRSAPRTLQNASRSVWRCWPVLSPWNTSSQSSRATPSKWGQIIGIWLICHITGWPRDSWDAGVCDSRNAVMN